MARKAIDVARVNAVYTVRSGALPAVGVASFRVGEQPVPRAQYIRAVVPAGTDPALVLRELAKAEKQGRVKVEREPEHKPVFKSAAGAPSSTRARTLREQVMDRCPDDPQVRSCLETALAEARL